MKRTKSDLKQVADAAVVGVSDHAGWAVLVAATANGTLIERRRIELVDEDLPAMPHHHDAQLLPLAEAEDMIERVRESAHRHAKLEFDAISRSIPQIEGVALRVCPELPPTTRERLRDYRAQNVADWVMYRRSLAEAARDRGWAVHWFDAH